MPAARLSNILLLCHGPALILYCRAALLPLAFTVILPSLLVVQSVKSSLSILKISGCSSTVMVTSPSASQPFEAVTVTR